MIDHRYQYHYCYKLGAIITAGRNHQQGRSGGRAYSSTRGSPHVMRATNGIILMGFVVLRMFRCLAVDAWDGKTE